MKLAHVEAERKKSNGFLSLRWIFCGLGVLFISMLLHGVMLPFADVTLFATTVAFAIVFSTLLSIFLLGEKFICRYDLPAAGLICVGAALTMIQMNTKIDLEYDRAKIAKCLISIESGLLVAMSVCIALCATAIYMRLKSVISQCKTDIQDCLTEKEKPNGIKNYMMQLFPSEDLPAPSVL